MTRSWHVGFGLMLTTVAGYVDAIGFIRLGGLYTSLVSGNLVQFAIALGQDTLVVALLPALLIGAFLAGAVVGNLVAALARARWITPAILCLEAVSVSVAASLAVTGAEVAVASFVLAFAMGAQNAALAHVKGFRAGTTFVTGALFGFAQHLALALLGRGKRLAWIGDGGVWLAFFAGAFAGTLANAYLAVAALAIAAGAVASLFLVASVMTLLAPGAAVTRSG